MAEVEPIVVEHNKNAGKDSSEGREKDSLSYESDSDQGGSAFALRRHVASDDEGEEYDVNSAGRDDYYEQDSEHHEGGPPVEEYEEDEEEEEDEYEDTDNDGIPTAGAMETRYDYDNEEATKDGGYQDRDDARKGHVTAAMGGAVEATLEGKKDAEPFVVPTAGAFYMHDDRFRYNGLAHPRRRSPGGRKLWEAKDEKPWLHDRFEELNLHDEGYPVQGGRGRRSRGRQMRILGSRKDAEHARGKSIIERSFDSSLQSRRRPPGRVQGVRRAKMDDYEFRESRVVTSKFLTQTASQEASSSMPSSLQNPASLESISNPQNAASKKPTIGSILKVSSPPFFPTGTALHTLSGMAGTSKASEDKTERDLSQGKLVHTLRSGMDREITSFPTTLRSTSSHEPSAGLTFVSNNGDAETGFHQTLARGSSSFHQQVPKPGPGTITQQPQRASKAELGIHTVDQPLPMSNRALATTQFLRVPPIPASSQQTGRAAPLGTQSIVLQPVQQLQQMQPMNQTLISSGQAIQSQTTVSFPGKSTIDLKSAPRPLGNNTGRGSLTPPMQAGRGSVVYGSSSLTNGSHGVIQFAGQPPQGGLGVPTGGYSSQQQFNFSNNSEVTWIPILASGGSNYNPPYISMDGISSSMYYTQQTSQASNFQPALGDSNYSKTLAVSNSLKASQKTESDDLGQQRRRYSQMTFGEERR